MDKQKFRNKKTFIIIIICCFVGLFSVMFYSVNSRFPQGKQVIHKKDSAFLYQNIEFKVTGFSFLNGKDIKNNKELMKAFNEPSTSDFKLLLTDVNLHNPTNKDVKVDLTAFHVESNDFSLQLYFPAMIYYNNCGMYVDLKSGERKTLKLPVPLSRSYFTSKAYKTVENRNYYLVYSLYPSKNMIKIK